MNEATLLSVRPASSTTTTGSGLSRVGPVYVPRSIYEGVRDMARAGRTPRVRLSPASIRDEMRAKCTGGACSANKPLGPAYRSLIAPPADLSEFERGQVLSGNADGFARDARVAVAADLTVAASDAH